jgi:hypothetical protein
MGASAFALLDETRTLRDRNGHAEADGGRFHANVKAFQRVPALRTPQRGEVRKTANFVTAVTSNRLRRRSFVIAVTLRPAPPL